MNSRLSGFLVTLAVALSPACGGPRDAGGPPGSLPTKAVSLRALQAALSTCAADATCRPAMFQLAGLTVLRGIVAGATSDDWILLGDEAPGAPPLLTEDLVVALRNAWLRYAVREGNALLYSNPGCSIDPSPEVVSQLGKVARQIQSELGRGAGTERFDSWHAACRTAQQVRVLGLPFDTHFAKVMVDADYYMKRLTDGSASTGIDGFVSLADRTLERVKDDVVRKRGAAEQTSWFNRFEFVPGETQYSQDEGIVLIDSCPVSLVTEGQYLSRHGTIAGTGTAEPLALAFAGEFTARYGEIAKEKAVYQELEGLFRAVAIAKLLKLKEAGGLDYFLDSFRVRRTEVPVTLVGVSAVKEFRHRRELANGYEDVQLCLPSCGGVGIDIDVADTQLKPSPLRQVRDAVLKARPSTKVIAWEFSARRK